MPERITTHSVQRNQAKAARHATSNPVSGVTKTKCTRVVIAGGEIQPNLGDPSVRSIHRESRYVWRWPAPVRRRRGWRSSHRLRFSQPSTHTLMPADRFQTLYSRHSILRNKGLVGFFSPWVPLEQHPRAAASACPFI